MSYRVELSNNFVKEAKSLIKKYASLKEELSELFSKLEQNPTLGTPPGNDIYKIRLAISSKNRGKSGGARVLSFVKLITQAYCFFQSTTKEKRTRFLPKKLKNF